MRRQMADAGRRKYAAPPFEVFANFLGYPLQDLEKRRTRADKQLITILRSIRGYGCNKGILGQLQEALGGSLQRLQRRQCFGSPVLRGQTVLATAAPKAGLVMNLAQSSRNNVRHSDSSDRVWITCELLGIVFGHGPFSLRFVIIGRGFLDHFRFVWLCSRRFKS